MLVAFAATMAFAILQPIQVLPRIRLAPGYALIDEGGQRVTSEDARGSITLYTFAPLRCDAECEHVNDVVAEVRDRVEAGVDLGGTPFQVVTIVLDHDASVDHVSATRTAVGADWTWLAGSGNQIDNIVGLGFHRSAEPEPFVPSYAIVDGWGMIRGEYRYQTLVDDADKLVRHIDLLGAELRNDSGFGSFVYGAAHAFQCYP